MEGNIWLPDINNDNNINEEYKSRLLAINDFVLVMFNNDTVVEPVETEVLEMMTSFLYYNFKYFFYLYFLDLVSFCPKYTSTSSFSFYG